MARFSLVRKGAIDLWKGFAADLRLTRLLETKAPESVEIKGISREKYNQRYEAYQQELREFRWGAREQIDRKKIEAERPKTADNTTDVSQRGMSENEKNSESVKLKAERRQKEMERKKLAQERRDASFKRESIRRKILEEEEDKRYAELLQQSRTWITEDTLDDRIKRALDQTVPLH